MADGWKQIWADLINTVRGASPTREARAERGERAERPDAVRDAPHVADPGPPPATSNDDTDLAPGAEHDAAASRATQPDVAAQAESQPTRRNRGRRIGLVTVVIVAFIGIASSVLWPRLEQFFAPPPPAPNVVASFEGGQITTEQLGAHLALFVPSEYQDRIRTPDNLRALVEEMVVDELIRRWAAERKVDGEERFRHTMQHISEDINVDSLHTQLHRSDITVQESQIQEYYRANQSEFGGKPLDQVRQEIRDGLVRETEPKYVKAYIERLKANASVTVDHSLLETPEPSEDDLRRYYEANREKFRLPAQVEVDEIQIPVGSEEAAARQRADAARLKLQSGLTFPETAQAIPGARLLTATNVVSGMRGPEWTTAVFALQPGALSDVLRDGELFSVVRLRARQPERIAGLTEVRSRVLAAAREQKAEEWFKANGDKTLITIKGQRHSLGQFYREYKELPAEVRGQYSGLEGRRKLVDRLIERMLIVEDSSDRLLDVKNKAELDETRLQLLKQIFHQENVDDKIKIGDDDVKKFFEQNRTRLVQPPKARIRYIRIGLGQTSDEEKRALEKADQAYRKLVPGWFQQGAEFAGVAREYSEDQESAAKGGELDDWIGEGSNILAELAEHRLHEQVLALQERQISAPFIYGDSVYIVQVIQRSEPQPLTLEQAAPSIKEELRLRQHDESLAKLSDQLKEQAGTTIYPSTLRAYFAEMQGAPARRAP